ncbi:MAG: hypothetical protein JW839_14455 [Candidatus Lokiarchaeota archaeon]|nr:hypothetical protein [Candidatus Lokiarchaeota archaeon]
MGFAFREVHIPSLLIAVIIGYQIAIYFFQQYRKSKHEQFPLNKIFLAFGLFFSCLLAGFVIRVVYNYYTSDPVLVDVLSMLAIVMVMASTVGFMSAVCNTGFAAIIQPRFTKGMIVLNLVPIAAIFFLHYKSELYQFLLLTYAGCLLFMLVFQLRLIKKATGGIKKRLATILAGEVMLGVSIALGSEQIAAVFGGYNQATETTWLVAIYGAIVGLTIVFLGTFKFPAFLEFDWQDSLVQLLVIDGTRSRLVYSYTFNSSDAILPPMAPGGQERGDPGGVEPARETLASHGLAGIDDVIQAVGKEDGKKVEKIAQGRLTILLEHQGDGLPPITYALLVNRDMRSADYFLSSVKAHFEAMYRGILDTLPSLKGEGLKLFGGFDAALKGHLG